MNSTDYVNFNLTNTDYAQGGLGRSAGVQAGYQLAALAVTLGLAIVTGVITGLILKTPLFEQVKDENEMFDDEPNWLVPTDELFVKSGEGQDYQEKSAKKDEPTFIAQV